MYFKLNKLYINMKMGFATYFSTIILYLVQFLDIIERKDTKRFNSSLE